jgi:ABC-2 type transport system permease protein
MRILTITLKDISQLIRDRKSLLFLVLMPVVFTLFMGFAFRGARDGEKDTRLPIGFANGDPEGTLSLQFRTILSSSDAIRLVDVNTEEMDQTAKQVRKGTLAATILIPADFSNRVLTQSADQNLLSQSSGAGNLLSIVVDDSTSTGQAVRQVIQTAFMRLLSSAETARLAAQEIDALQPLKDADARRSVLEASAVQAGEAWQKPILVMDIQKAGVPATSSGPWGENPYNQSSPGMIVQFAIFGLVASSMVLLLERKSRTLQRMLTTSTSRAEIIAGHFLTIFLTVFLQELILVVFAQILLGVNYLREPLAVLLVMVVLALWIAGLGMLIGVIAKAEDQVILFSMLAMFIFTALAGAWFPLEGTGPAFSAIGRLTPGAAAMSGFQNIIVRGLGFSSVLIPSAMLLGFAVLFFGLALWRFRFE